MQRCQPHWQIPREVSYHPRASTEVQSAPLPSKVLLVELEGSESNVTLSTQPTIQMMNFKMPTRINLHEVGPCLSIRLMNATKQKKAKAHVIFDTRAKSTMLGLFTMISIVNSLSLPNYQDGKNETTKDCLI